MHHAGDAVLAEVGDTVDALDCAVCVQKRFTRGNFDEAIRNYEIAIYLDDNLTDRLNRKPGLLAEAAVASSSLSDLGSTYCGKAPAVRFPDRSRKNSYGHSPQAIEKPASQR